jgi:hypothetical protein
MRRFWTIAAAGWLISLPAVLHAETAPAEPGAAPAAIAPAAEAVAPAPTEAKSETPLEPSPVSKPAEPAPPPEPTLLVNINLTTQRMVVTEGGKPKYTWAVSSGAYGYPTPTGTFKPSWMSKMWYSKQYDNAPMPHSIFFKNGAAIHATSSINLLGTPASHGCVRLAPSNAAKLYALVSRHGKERTRITVHGRPNYKTQKIARLRASGSRQRQAYSPYSYGYGTYAAPRYVYPGDAPPRYYYGSKKQRAAALKKRRAATRQYYSSY